MAAQQKQAVPTHPYSISNPFRRLGELRQQSQGKFPYEELIEFSVRLLHLLLSHLFHLSFN